MGYHGALSQGCQRCRTRKVKCDEAKPKCLTCEKANLICTGYRDLNAIVFRDESPRIVRRIEKKAAKKARLAAAASRRSSISSPQGSSSSSSSSSNSEGFPNIHPPLESIDNVEVKFFVYNYAFHDVWRSEAYERWVFDSIKGKDDLSQGLRAAIGAAGCAGLSNVRMAPGAAARSRMLYGKALGIVNAALRRDLKVVPDALLLTVVILGLHEIISFNVSRDNRAWQSHINGAAALLELRGVTQFKNERGVQLYFQIRNQILATCIQHSFAVPESLLRLDETFSASYMHRVLLKSHKITPISVFNLWAECIDILHLLKNAQPGVVQRAITLDNQLSKWTATLPEEWYFRILAAPDAPFKLEHEYSSTWIAYVWNNWRLLRTVTNLLIAEGGVDRDERRMRIALILQYSKDICIASRFSNAECALAHFRPLFGVATAFHSTPQLREFAAKQLQLIAQISGIQQAKTTADEILALIDRKKKPDEGDMLTDEWVTPF